MPELTISDDLLLEVCLEGETPLVAQNMAQNSCEGVS